MRTHFADAGVFIRSFATRGAKGGVSASIRDAIHVLDGAGRDVIFVETIGVGQDELEIARLAYLVVVVLIPEMGDEVQGMKAGLAEIADILVVNKADLPGADVTVQQLKATFSDFDILLTSAINDDGAQRVVDEIEKHRLKSLRNGQQQSKRLSLCREELLSLLRQRLVTQLAQRIDDRLLDERVKRIAERRVDPYSEVEQMARKLGF
jgi:LAO/AO transport system kinase